MQGNNENVSKEHSDLTTEIHGLTRHRDKLLNDIDAMRVRDERIAELEHRQDNVVRKSMFKGLTWLWVVVGVEATYIILQRIFHW